MQRLRDIAKRAEELRVRDQRDQREQALELGRIGFDEAVRANSPTACAYFLNLTAWIHFRSGDYSKALEDFIRLRDLALKEGLRMRAATALLNLSSLYWHVFDTASALAAAEDAYAIVPANEPQVRSQILIQLGRVLLARGDRQRASRLLSEALEVAFAQGDTQNESLAWDCMGAEYLRVGDTAHAEPALSNAYRIRLLARDPNLYVSQYYLAELQLKLGNKSLAHRLIDKAFDNRLGDRVQIPPHLMFATRARILEAEGNLEAALTDYLRAADAAEDWRSRGLAADSFRISTDVMLGAKALGEDAGIYDSAVDAAVALYQKTKDTRYAELSWQLKERVRAASLREMMGRGRGWTRRLPPEYWTNLDQLRALEGDELGALTPSAATREQIARLRLTLAEMEARAASATAKGSPTKGNDTPPAPRDYSIPFKSLEIFPDSASLTHVGAALGSSRTLISFHTGEAASYRWTITNRTFDLKVLPGKRELRAKVEQMRSAIDKDKTNAETVSASLFADLFGGLSGSASQGPWLVALDEGLFELPLAALVSRREGRPVYLAEDRAVELIPGAWAISSATDAAHPGSFLGAADGIYNTADPRYRTPGAWWRNLATPARSDRATIRQWPRLMASGMEIRQCSMRSAAPAHLLTGAELNRKSFVAALASQPAYIHIATHILWNEAERKSAIALGIAPRADGSPNLELLTADDIANLRTPGAVVVMSGCASLKGEEAPAAGLLGLSRAWLAAGAGAVIATLWPTPDDAGDLLARFYQHLHSDAQSDRLAPAEALRRAQVDMLHSKTERADPKYWAAYQVMGRSN
ncbi:MAG: CHAT domain-containing protein [Acidobacteria bacterium]|nr:CHAT domain-containing protein [Acidobacteriota bacterium]